MRVTRLGPPVAALTSGMGAQAGSIVPGGGAALTVLTSNGSNGRYWGENVRRITSNGSNTLLSPDVNFASGSNIVFTLDAGPGGSVPSNTLRIHGQAGGVMNLTSNGSNSLTGLVNLQAGEGIALGVSGQTITIVNTRAGPFDGGGGAAGPLLYIDDVALHAKGDEFGDATLAAWTLAGGLTTADVTAVTTEPYDATCLDVRFQAQSDRMYQAIPTPASGDFEVYLTLHGITNSTPSPPTAMGGMIGLYFSNDAGTGTGVSYYSDSSSYLWVVASNAYSSTGPTIGGFPVAGYAASNMPIVYKLKKVGTTITGGVSDNGGLGFKTNTRTDATTFTRMGIIRLFSGGGTDPTLRVGRFNVVEL